ncbi:MAG: MMPL family transporter [Treponema sp.]|nr:MMPL family transporter [Treponema sp.]
MIKKMLKFSWGIIGLCLAITVFFAFQLKNIKIENTSRTFMPKDDDSYQFMLQAEDTFGSMLVLGISLETQDETILTPAYISIVDKITQKIEKVEYVESIDSITNIDFIYGKVNDEGEGSLEAGSLLGDDGEYTGSREDMRLIKQKIIDWQEMYNRVIVNDSFTATQMLITVTASDENGDELPAATQRKILSEVQEICNEELKGSGLEIRYFGDPVMSHDAQDFLISDLKNLIPFVAIIVLASLYFSFHTWSGTLFPLITVLVSTVWSIGLLCLLGFTFTIIGSMIPVCLIACGSAYGIHVMTHYYVGIDAIKGEITKEKHAGAIEFALKDVWIAVVLAAITTVAGFISNISSPLRPLRSFSIFAAAGVVFALILSVTLIPAMLYVTPLNVVGKHWRNKDRLTAKIKRRIALEVSRRRGHSSDEASGQTMYSIYHFFAGSKSRLIIFILFIAIFSVVGVKKLIVDTAMVNYFPPDSKFRKDLAYVDETLSGSNSMYVVVRGKEMTTDDTAVKNEEFDYGDFDFTDHSSENSADAGADTGATSQDIVADFDFGTSDAASDFDFSGAADIADGFDFGGEGASEGEAQAVSYHMLTNPDILKAVDNMQNYLIATHPEIGKIVSFTTFIKRMNQVMNVPVNNGENGETNSLGETITMQQLLSLLNRAYAMTGGSKASMNEIVRELEKELNFEGMDYYEIPYDESKYPVDTHEQLSDLVTQYLYLLSSDQITRFADDMTNPKAIRLQVQLRTHSTVDTGLLIDDIKAYAAKNFPEGYEIEATGTAALENRMSHLVINSQMVSIVFSLLMVFLIIALSFKSPLAGLIGAIPLALVILLNFMVMGFSGIRLDLCTSIVSSIAIGVGIDYTIHFMETYQNQRAVMYKRELEANAQIAQGEYEDALSKMSGGYAADLEEVTRMTFNTSGKGIVTNALAVGLGFLVLMFSKFIILRYIGALVAVVMFTSSSLAMTIIPGILNAFDPKFMWLKEEREVYKKEIALEKERKSKK